MMVGALVVVAAVMASVAKLVAGLLYTNEILASLKGSMKDISWMHFKQKLFLRLDPCIYQLDTFVFVLKVMSCMDH